MSALPVDTDSPIAVQTMTVSVNTMRVGKKQVTLSMFKQLPEADIFTDKFQNSITCQPWGVVRYYWGDYHTKGFHVVFVMDGALHRCFVSKVYGFNNDYYIKDHPSYIDNSRLIKAFTGEDELKPYDYHREGLLQGMIDIASKRMEFDLKPILDDIGYPSPDFTGEERIAFLVARDERIRLNQGLYSENREITLNGATKAAESFLQERAKNLSTIERYTDKLKADHDAMFAELKALPQLFIAV